MVPDLDDLLEGVVGVGGPQVGAGEAFLDGDDEIPDVAVAGLDGAGFAGVDVGVGDDGLELGGAAAVGAEAVGERGGAAVGG